jgi:hypothetical protein
MGFKWEFKGLKVKEQAIEFRLSYAICSKTNNMTIESGDIIIVIIIIILGITFMQVIYTYIPETNHVPREDCVVTILM